MLERYGIMGSEVQRNSETARVGDSAKPDGIQRSRQQVFSVDSKVTIELEVTFALTLGDYLVDTRPENSALWALGKRLSEIVPPKRSSQDRYEERD